MQPPSVTALSKAHLIALDLLDFNTTAFMSHEVGDQDISVLQHPARASPEEHLGAALVMSFSATCYTKWIFIRKKVCVCVGGGGVGLNNNITITAKSDRRLIILKRFVAAAAG